jgi:hypothetical protein
VLAAPASAATIVINGSFEDGVPGNTPGLNNGATFANMPTSGPSWDRWTAINGWTTASGPGIEIQSNRTLGSIDAHSGSYYVELDSNGNSRMVQSVALAAGDYVLSFWYSPRTNVAGTNGISWQVGSLAAGSVVNTAVGIWTQITTTFTVASAGSYALSFAAIGTSDSFGGFVDSVSIDPAPIPVPAAGFLLAGALGALALRRRKAA